MPGFDDIIGQPLPIRLLQLFIRKAMVPHALLFSGIEGIGKKSAAKLFAQALNCESANTAAGEPGKNGMPLPCGRCRACRQISDGSHPDIITVMPRKGMLRIDQIRELNNSLALKPFSAAHRVAVVADAHTMNPEAGNALLKMLEEPPGGTILILTAPQPTDLLPTIASRCRHIRFNPLGAHDLSLLLMKKMRTMRAEQAETIADLADGSCTRALRLAETGWREQRDWVVRAAGLDRPIDAKQRSAALAMAFAAQLALRKDHVGTDLEILKTWIRDLSIWPYQPRMVVNRDRRDALASVRAGIDGRQLTSLWETVEKAQRAIAANGNMRLTLDVMALHMDDIFARRQAKRTV
ncbi:MAG: hypothetical protein VR64_01185 [Desulfatitalea sp. BRH_c12]|nr:MAG: hypothetical protein VR64_01185 [Desulfatitalea sp. BRH_c12]